MKKLELILATDYEEFYYEDTNAVVPEGEAVGVDCILKDRIDFYLFDNIYHEFKYEEV